MNLKEIKSSSVIIFPGETLKEFIEGNEMTQLDLAQRTSISPKTINEIIQGKNPISYDTAIKFAKVFGTSPNFWNNLEINYQNKLAEMRLEEEFEKSKGELSKFSCYAELAKIGFVENTKIKKEKVKNLLKFFGVSSLSLIPEIQAVAFRKTNQKNLSKESLAAWLRCGELEAQKIDAKPFNKEILNESIGRLRSLTNEGPGSFQKKLVELCASFGVAVVFTPYFKRTYVNGATKWINSEKALIQMSSKGKSNDIFWFSFFHELGHIVKHGKKEEFIELDKTENEVLLQKENEADEFACETLIPKSDYLSFVEQKDYSELAIINFAKKLGIDAGIVVGRLSHEYNSWNKFNNLKTKLDFI